MLYFSQQECEQKAAGFTLGLNPLLEMGQRETGPILFLTLLLKKFYIRSELRLKSIEVDSFVIKLATYAGSIRY